MQDSKSPFKGFQKQDSRKLESMLNFKYQSTLVCLLLIAKKQRGRSEEALLFLEVKLSSLHLSVR